MEKYDFPKENPILFKKYKVMQKLGEGSFGEVYLGQAIYNAEFLAIKAEQKKNWKICIRIRSFYT